MPGDEGFVILFRGSKSGCVVGSFRVTGRRYFGKQIVTPTKKNLGTFKEEISDLHHRPFCLSPPGHNVCIDARFQFGSVYYRKEGKHFLSCSSGLHILFLVK